MEYWKSMCRAEDPNKKFRLNQAIIRDQVENWRAQPTEAESSPNGAKSQQKTGNDPIYRKLSR